MKRFVITVAAVFCAGSIMTYLVMNVLLGSDVAALGTLVRPQHQRSMPLLLLANLIAATAFVWIYSRGAEAKPWIGQGLRLGLAAWLFRPASIFLVNHAVMPFPIGFVVKQMVFTLPLVLVLGLIAAYMYRSA